MSAAIAIPGNSASMFPIHYFGGDLDGDDRFVVERFRALACGDIRPIRDGAGRRKSKRTAVSRTREVRDRDDTPDALGEAFRIMAQGVGPDGSDFGRGPEPRRTSGETGSSARVGEPRRSRTIRFSDSECNWSRMRPCTRGSQPANSSEPSCSPRPRSVSPGPPGLALTPGHLALSEATYRVVYVLATITREEMIDAERGKELDEIVEAARKTMRETMDEGPG